MDRNRDPGIYMVAEADECRLADVPHFAARIGEHPAHCLVGVAWPEVPEIEVAQRRGR